jgi:RNA polymerase sporulation-specific sigma factor
MIVIEKLKSIFDSFITEKFIKLWRRLGILSEKTAGVYYVNGAETLPPPLSKEYEDEIFSRINVLLQGGTSVETGNRSKTELVKLRKLLISHNLRLVVYISKKFESTGINIEDLVSIGTIGLIKAVNTFSVERNIKLATYASRCIENEILMFLRKSTQHKNDISLDEPLNIDWDGNELLLSDILGSDGEEVTGNCETQAERSVLLEAVNRLPEREREILRMSFGLAGGPEKTHNEVADIFGISQSYISRLEKRIIKRLKQEIERVIL